MSEGRRTDLLVLVGLAAAAAALVGWLIVRSKSPRVDPLAAVPSDAFLVASVDIVALAGSPLGEALVGEGGARSGALLGVDSVAATCGFDPLPHLRAIAVALPEGGDRGDFGVAATGDLGKEMLASCAKALVAKRGGQATTREVGTFTVVSDTSTPGAAEVAFRDGGPYLVGRGTWLARMMDAAEGRTETVLSAGSRHAALRAELRVQDVDAEAFVLSAVLPRGVRDRIGREMASEPDAGGTSPTMESVLAVSEGAIGLHAGRPHEQTRAVAELHCESEAACASVSKLVLHLRLGWSGNLAYRLLGLGALIDGLEVRQQGTSLVLHTNAPADDLAKTISRALHPPARPKPREHAASPDEILKFSRDGG